MGWDNAGHEPLRPDVVTQKRVDSRGPARVAHGPRCFRARTQGLHTGMPRHADCGGRVVLWLAPPLGHATRSPCPAAPRGLPGRRARNMGCPTAHRTTKGAQPPRRCHWAGRLTSQRRSAAARRRPPPSATVQAGRAQLYRRAGGMGWLGRATPGFHAQLVRPTTGPWQRREPRGFEEIRTVAFARPAARLVNFAAT